MKAKVKMAAFIAATFLAIGKSAHAKEGVGSHGADLFAMGFSQIANGLIETALAAKPTLLTAEEEQALNKALRNTSFLVEAKRLCPTSRPNCSATDSLIARNDPQVMLITVNPIRFFEPAALAQSDLIIVHEYLGIAGLEQSSFGLSAQIVAAAHSDQPGMRKLQEATAARRRQTINLSTDETIQALKPGAKGPLVKTYNMARICNALGYAGFAGGSESESNTYKDRAVSKAVSVSVNALDGTVTVAPQTTSRDEEFYLGVRCLAL